VEFYFNNLQQLFKQIDGDKGYILEVDLIYPTALRDDHMELPLAPEHYDGKLSPNLYSKYNYRLRLENLKFYVENGMILKRIIKIMEFTQKKWLKKYIDTNTEMRKNAKDEAAKNFYKLMNNAVYGKTMENVFGRKNFKLVGENDEKKIIKLTHSNKFKKEYILSPNLVILEMEKDDVIFNKPIYVGFSILELSKLHMYKLHYNFFKEYYGSKAILMYMDTDSLIYEIETADIYEDMKKKEELFDMSVYNKGFKYYDEKNKGVLGTLKDEFGDNLIKEFVCLRSKCYSIKIDNETEIKKCKGVMKSELSKIKHEIYKKCNNEGGVVEVSQKTFKSVNHRIYTIKTIKDGLSRFDNKRQIDGRFGNAIFTVPWGYNKENNED
jgi:hypothetical protein